MNFYREWKRWYVDFEISFSAGRYPEPTQDEIVLKAMLDNAFHRSGSFTTYESDFGSASVTGFVGKPDEYSADDTLPHVGPTVWEIKNQQDLHDSLQQAWVQSQAAHPFQDPDALTGNITTPAGAQDFQVAYDEKGGEAGWAVEPRNWVDQERDGS